MDGLLRIAYGTCRVGAWFGGLVILISSGLIVIEVVIRKLFAITIGGADELAGYALGMGSTWAFGFALFRRAHIRIDSLYGLFPAPVCAVLDIVSLATFAGFMGLVSWHAYGVLHQSAVLGSVSLQALEVPLAIPQLFWLLGLIVFLVAAALLLARSMVALVRGDLATVARLIGPPSAVEEAVHEVEDLERRRSQGDARR